MLYILVSCASPLLHEWTLAGLWNRTNREPQTWFWRNALAEKNTSASHLFAWKETFFFFCAQSDLWFGTRAKSVTTLEKNERGKKRWHYISAKRQYFTLSVRRNGSRDWVQLGGSRHAGRRCWFRAFSQRSLTLMKKKTKKKNHTKGIASLVFPAKLGIMRKSAAGSVLLPRVGKPPTGSL